jgi:hypothetical protein
MSLPTFHTANITSTASAITTTTTTPMNQGRKRALMEKGKRSGRRPDAPLPSRRGSCFSRKAEALNEGQSPEVVSA